MRKTWIAVAVAVLALAGCGSDDEAAGDAPQAAPDVEDCGSYESRNEAPTDETREKNRCLLGAFEAGREAKLVVTLSTVEGDPITHYFTVTDVREVEVLIDGTKDAFGPGDWYASTCTGLSEMSGRISWTGCTKSELPADLPETNPQQPS
jgi:hypothetical protein